MSNWDEDPIRAVYVATNSFRDAYGPNDYRECLEAIYNDFYYEHPKEWFKVLWQWDGFVLGGQNQVRHFICFDPDILKITGVYDNADKGN